MIFESKIDKKYFLQLENLLFFNSQQLNFINEIRNSVDRFGLPKINQIGSDLVIQIEGIPQVQNLFLVDNINELLIGMAIFIRENYQTISIIHIALNENYNVKNNEKKLFLLEFLTEIKQIAKFIKGITCIKLIYSKKTILLRVG